MVFDWQIAKINFFYLIITAKNFRADLRVLLHVPRRVSSFYLPAELPAANSAAAASCWFRLRPGGRAVWGVWRVVVCAGCVELAIKRAG